MNFNTNQNRQFYVVAAAEAKKCNEGAYLYLTLAKGKGNSRTDLINNVQYINETSSEELAVRKTVATATLDGKFEVGIPVLLSVEIPNYAGGGDEYTRSTIISIKPASASALTTDAKEINKQLAKAFPEYDVTATITATSVAITANYKTSNWRLGVSPMRTTTLHIAGDHVTKVTVAEGDSIANTGNMILADLEYFCMGERGDQYRMMGYPNVIPTTYFIDVTTPEYTIFDIHCAYVGPNEMAQKSEKDITIVVIGDGATVKTELNKLSDIQVTTPVDAA